MEDKAIHITVPHDERVENARNTLTLNGFLIKHDGNQIPIIKDSRDTLWYRAEDIITHICEFDDFESVLRRYVHKDHKSTLEDIDCDVDDYNMESLDTSDVYITEPGLYALMLRSYSKVCNKFRHHIVCDILPSINAFGDFRYTIDKIDTTSDSTLRKIELESRKKMNETAFLSNKIKLHELQMESMNMARDLVESSTTEHVTNVLSVMKSFRS